MKILPILGFYLKHSAQIEALVNSGTKSGGGHLMLDMVEANAPILKAQRPDLNANNLIDDAVSTLRDMLSDDAPPAEGKPRSDTPGS